MSKEKPTNECPICGGIHPPGACPKEERDLSPEEKKEQEEIQKNLEFHLSEGLISDAEKIIALAEKKNIPLDLASAFQKGLGFCLSWGGISNTEKIIALAEKKNIPLDFSKPEIISACQKGLGFCLSWGGISNTEKIIAFAEKKNIPLDLASAFQKGLEFRLSRGEVSDAEEIIALAEKKNIPLDFSKPEIASAFQKGLESRLSWGVFEAERVIALAEKKNIPLDFSKPEIASAFQKGLESCLSRGKISDAEEIITFAEKKNIPLDLASVCQKGLEKALLEGDIEIAEKINNRFLHLSPAKAFELLSPHLKEILDKFEKDLPQFVAQTQKSVDLLFSLFSFRKDPERLFKTLETYPFLAEALANNPRFGAKLILKYPEFDNVSKEKIKFLFQAKKEILSQNPKLDPNSFEFRKLMQERLLSFDRNREIVEELQKAGINLEKWLNYQEIQYFTLSSGKELTPFSERVQLPISRLGETITTYAYQIKDVLSEYRNDLEEIKVLTKEGERIEEQIKKMEEELKKAKEIGNEGKVRGISKGLEGLKAKLSRIKKISLWDRLMGEINSFTVLKEELISSQEELITAEKKYQELLTSKAPSGAELARCKSQINQIKEKIKNLLSQLERRVNDFRQNLERLLSPLNTEKVPDRASALVQEINERVAEQFNHYEVDRNTLASLFSEKAETEKEKLEGTPMSIFVWARNPDIDLYQGNYSPCCICIESAHMGSESPLADYTTDLGIQIVNIWDEIKNEPVTAAWCWLGIDEKGRTALVVDNIESNTTYSSNFPTELWIQLRTYLEKYAKAIGVDRLVLGKANNDLPSATELSKLPEAEAKYIKLGGQNSRPNGYYLEAEEKTVKLLWERKMKAKEVKEKRSKIKLKNLEIKELSEKDFERIISLEKQVYEEEIVRGREMINEMKEKNGLKYSVVLYGQRLRKKEKELLGYLIAYEDKTDEGKDCIYLDDIVVAPDVQGLGLGWQMLEKVISRLKEEASRLGKPILFDMHLRETSQTLFEKHKEDLEKMGVSLVESVLVPDYYDEGEDALYCVYEVKA
jgi:ribosomal protein S18 acetylase RimI-like enzyme/type III secretion system FlhB-like substrate exporter